MTLCSYDANSDQNVTATNKLYLNKNKIILLFKFLLLCNKNTIK